MRLLTTLLVFFTILDFTSAQTLKPAQFSTDGQVETLVRDGDTLFVGGSFSRVGISTENYTVLPADSDTPEIDGLAPNSTVRAAVADGEGGWYIAGSFTSVNGTTRQRVAHILPDQALDPNFSLSVNSTVYALALDDDHLYIGGSFTEVEGISVQRAVRANKVTGSLDNNWLPAIDNGTVHRIIKIEDEVYVGGSFSSAAGNNTHRYFAGFSATDGALIPGPSVNSTVYDIRRDGAALYLAGQFSSGGAFQQNLAAFSLDSNTPDPGFAFANNTVRTVIPDGNGGWYAAGSFSQAGGISQDRVAHILPDGSNDPDFNVSANGTVYSLALDGDRLYAGGTMSNVNGESVSRLVALDSQTGETVSAFTANVNSTVRSVLVNGDDLYVGGSFTNINGNDKTRYFARLDKNDGAVLPSTSVNSTVYAVKSADNGHYMGGNFSQAGYYKPNMAMLSADNDVPDWDFPELASTGRTALADGEGGWYIGGSFSSVTGGSNSRVVHLLADDSVDPDFTCNTNGTVYTMALDGSHIYVGGTFSSLNGESVTRLARVNRNTGVRDAAWNPDPNSTVRTIRTDGAKIYVGGSFTSISGNSNTRYFAAFEKTSGDLLKTAALNSTVYASALGADNEIYIGGAFSASGYYAPNLQFFDGNSGEAEFATAMPNSTVRTAIDDGNGGLYIAGSFSNVDGYNSARISHILPDGSLDQNFNATLTGTVYTLLLDGNDLYAGGSSTNVTGTEAVRLIRFDAATGAADPSFAPAINSTVQGLIKIGDTLFFGGSFSAVNGEERLRLAALDTEGNLLDWNPEANSTVQVLRVHDGLIYAGGSFTEIGGASRARIAVLDPASDNAAAWNAGNFNNTVLDLKIDGNHLYAVGNFTTAGGESRNRIARLDAATGALDSFSPDVSSTVNSVDISGNLLAIGGSFGSVNETSRPRLAEIDLSTGQLTDRNPRFDGTVEAVLYANGKLAAGGGFSYSEYRTRSRLIAYDTEALTNTDFNAGSINNTVLTLLRSGDLLYAGGNFTTFAGTSKIRAAALDLTDGTLTAFDPQPNNSVNAIAINEDRIYIGGDFTQLGGESYPRAAAIDRISGNIVEDWRPVPDNSIEAIALDGDRVLICGSWTFLKRTSPDNLARYDEESFEASSVSSGSINSTIFTMAGAGDKLYIGGNFTNVLGESRQRLARIDLNSGTADAFELNANNTVERLVFENGKLYIAGDFTSLGGEPHSRAAVYDADAGELLAWNPGFDGTVYALVPTPDGTGVIAGGNFDQVSPDAAARLTKFDTETKSFDPAFNVGVNNSVYALALKGDTVFLGGTFSSAGGNSLQRLAAANKFTGAVFEDFDAGGISSTVNGLTIIGNRLYMGGSFSTVGGETRPNAAVLDLPAGTLSALDYRFDNTVQTVENDGEKVIFGGSFGLTKYRSRQRFAAINIQTNEDLGYGVNFNNTVHSIALTDGKIWLGGSFTSASGQSRGRVAAINRSDKSLSPVDAEASSTVHAVLPAGDRIFIGGSFTSVKGENRNRFAAINAETGALDPLDLSFSSTVRAFAEADDILYAGGSFSSVSGEDRNRVAAVDLTDGSLTDFDPAASSTVYTLLTSGNLLYIGGNFTSMGGESRGRLAAVNRTDGTPTAFNPEFNSTVHGIAIDQNYLFAAGSMTDMGGTSVSRLVLLDRGTGEHIFDFAPEFSSTVYAINYSDEALFAGGVYTRIGGNYAQRYLSRFHIPPPGSVIFEAELTSLTDFNGFDIDCFGQNTGEIEISVSGGAAPYSYTLTGGSAVRNGTIDTAENPATEAGLAAGNYTLNVTDAADGTANTSINLSQPGNFTADVSTDNPIETEGGAEGVLSAVLSGGTAPFDFTYTQSGAEPVVGVIEDGSTPYLIEGLSAGSYVFSFTDANGCTTSATENLPDYVPMTLQFTVLSQISCNGDEDGRLRIRPFNGVPPYSFVLESEDPEFERSGTINSSGSSSTQNNLPPGTYTVTVTDQTGAEISGDPLTLNDPPELFAEAEVTADVTQPGADDGVIELTITGGVPNYSYSIIRNGSWSGSGSSEDGNVTRTGLQPGEYVFNITDGVSCQISTAPVSVLELNPCEDFGPEFIFDECGACIENGESNPEWNASCTDCNGEINGEAFIDQCGICAGGTTGVVPDAACADCAGVPNGDAETDECGECIAGGPASEAWNASCADCAGIADGTAFIDPCGNCVGGSTGLEACEGESFLTCIDDQTIEACTYTHSGGDWDALLEDGCNTSAVTSTFDAGAEGWSFDTSGDPSVSITWLENGGNPGGHLRLNEPGQGTGDWLSAPDDYLGDKSAYYGGSFAFDLKISGSVGSSNVNHVRLIGGGLTLNATISPNPTTNWQSYNVPFTEGAWRVGSGSTQATAEQIQTVLADLQTLFIWADWIIGSEQVFLDNAEMTPGPPTYTLTGATEGTGSTLDGTAFNSGITEVTWSYTDGCGNQPSCAYTVTLSAVDVSLTGDSGPVCPEDAVTLTATSTAEGAAYVWSTGETGETITAGPGTYTVTVTDSEGCAGVSESFTVSSKPTDDCGVCYDSEDDPNWNTTCLDCAGEVNGTATIDDCGFCTGGSTGLPPNTECFDCLGVPDGPALPGTPCTSAGNEGTWSFDCECDIPLPDLAVLNVASDTSFYTSGSEAEVTWTVANIGEGASPVMWNERIFVESAAGANRTLLSQSNFSLPENLAAGNDIERSRTVTLPAPFIIGDQGRFVVRIVPGSGITEVPGGTDNNTALQAEIWDMERVLIINAPETVTEGNAVDVTVTRTGSVTAPLTVNLSITDPERFTLPETVTIFAGQASRNFTLSAVNNSVLEPPTEVTLTADADSFDPAERVLTLFDNESPKLSLSDIPETAAQGDTVTFTVATNLAPEENLAVALSSSSNSRFPLPASVSIPAGNLSAEVTTVVPVNNTPLLATDATVTATASGHSPASEALTLAESNIPGITFTIQADTVSESNGFLATEGKITRVPGTNAVPMNVNIAANLPNTLIFPPQVGMAANVSEVTFNIGVVDNDIVDGFRDVNVSAAVFIPSCNCPAPEGSPGYNTDIVTVADNDGPTLSLTVAPLTMAEGLENAGTITVTRNTPTDAALTVFLSSDDTTEAVLPPSVVIPAGSASLDVPVATLDDGVPDGNQQVYFNASAPGFSPGVVWAIVTDINLPDLTIPETELLQSELQAFETFSYKVFVKNTGFATAPSGVRVQGFLTQGTSINASSILVTDDVIPNSIAAGAVAEVFSAASVPNEPGDWNLIWQVNGNSTVSELIFSNNFSQPEAVHINPDYTAVASVADSISFRGVPVPVTGSAERAAGGPAADEDIEVYILNNGTRREVMTTTDAEGNFTTEFQPLPTESGRYTVGASYPGLGETEEQDYFDILGVRVNNGIIPEFLVETGDTLTGTLPIRNRSGRAMPNLTILPVNLPEGAEITFETLDVLDAYEESEIGYTVTGNVVSPGVNFIPASFKAVCDFGDIQNTDMFYYCKSPGGYLNSTISSIQTTASETAGYSQVTFRVFNTGNGPTGPVSLSLPSVSWVQNITPVNMPSIAPNDTAVVVVRFLANNDVPFNFPVTGNIAVNAENAAGINLPFSFEKVSEADGTVRVSVSNQFTYFADDGPMVEDAWVRIRNYYSGEIYAEGYTDENGIFEAGDIPEGTQRIQVQKEQHLNYDDVVTVNPGTVNNKAVFLNYQAVTFSWDVVPTAVEDVYDITLTTVFETSVPIPVVTVDMPNSVPELFGDEVFAFNVTLTNHGLITARDVELQIPDNDPVYEFIYNYEPADMPALSSFQVPVIMRIRDNAPDNTEDYGGSATVGGISEFLGMEESSYMQYSSTGLNCQDFVATAYWYYCGGNGLWQTGGSLFTYEGRVCTGSGGGPGGVGTSTCCGSISYGNCANCPPPGGSGSAGTPTPATTNISSCWDCLADLGLTAAGCFGVPTLPLDLARCISSARRVRCAAEAVGGSLLPGPLGCINGILGTLQTCSNTALGGAGGAVGGTPAPGGLVAETSSGLPAVFDQIILDLEQFTEAAEASQNSTLEYMGQTLAASEIMGEIAPIVNPYFDDLVPFSPTVEDQLVSIAEGYSVTEADILAFTDRWNTSLQAYSEGVTSPNEEYPNIVDFDYADAQAAVLADGQAYAESRGAEDLAELAMTAIETTESAGDQASGAVCASVTIQINQELTMTREAFEGTLTVFNGHPTDALDSLTVNLEVRLLNGESTTELFQIETIQLTNLSDVEGTGAIAAEEEGSAKFLFIPTIQAAPTEPVIHSFGGSVTYWDPFAAAMVTIPLTPVDLTVNPSPDLFLRYFLERNILGDDPLIPETVQPSVPAELAVMIENSGFGPAVNVNISSAQPEIVDNEMGLAIDFNLIGSSLAGQPTNLGITDINFGNIQAQSSKIGQWWFTSSLLGKFVSYEAEVVHASSFGNPDLSLVNGIELHELTRSIRVYGDEDDGMNDFLVNDVFDDEDIPDIIYLSQGFQTYPVLPAEEGSFDQAVSAPSFTNTLTVKAQEPGWTFIKLDDPGNGQFDIESVTRSDGQEIPLDNAWLTFVTLPATQSPVYEDKFHFVDDLATTEETTYTVTWTPKDFDVPEVVEFIGIPENVTGEQVTEITVVFSKEIDPETFTFEDLGLILQGEFLELDDQVTITQDDPFTFTADISAFTQGNGFFLFSVQTAEIQDIFGISGSEGQQAGWSQFLDIPVVQAFEDLPEGNLSAGFDLVTVFFNLAIDSTSAAEDRFFVMKDGNSLGNLTIDSVSTDHRRYYLSGLGDLLTEDGTYEIAVDLPNLLSTGGIPGEEVQSTEITLKTTGPVAAVLTPVNEGGIDSQHINFVDIQFEEDIFSFNIADVELTRDGETIFLNIAQLSNPNAVGSDFWRAGNFQLLTYPDGEYNFRVNFSGINDAAGNPGEGFAEVSWTADRSAGIELSDLAIHPDLGISDADGITHGSDFDIEFNMSADAAQVTVSQTDFGDEFILAVVNGADSGAVSIPVSFPTGGNTGVKVTATAAGGGFVSIERDLFLDEAPLSAEWVTDPGQGLNAQPPGLTLSFGSQLLDPSALDSALTLRRNGQVVAAAQPISAQLDNTVFDISNLESAGNTPGNYSLAVDLALLKKRSSGIPGNTVPTVTWSIASQNQAPTADAGPDILATETGTYTLDGTGSSDPDGDSLTYEWTAPQGVALSNPASATPEFSVTEAQQGSSLSFLLIVSDGQAFDSDAVTVVVDLDDAPVFECPEIPADNGDPCMVGDQPGVVTDCDCLLFDCNGDLGGTAAIDACGTCAGGETGIEPCVADCFGVEGGDALFDDCGICRLPDDPDFNTTCLDCEGVVNGPEVPGTVCETDGMPGIINTDCTCTLIDLDAPCRYFMSDYGDEENSPTEVYELFFDTAVTRSVMVPLFSVPYRASIAYDAENAVLWLVNVDAPAYQPADVSDFTPVLGDVVNLPFQATGFTGATWSPDGFLAVACESPQGTWLLDTETQAPSQYSNALVKGGDIFFDDSGVLKLVSRDPNRLFNIYPDAPNQALNLTTDSATGMMAFGEEEALVLIRGRRRLRLGTLEGVSLGTGYRLYLNGEVFTPTEGDLASGCFTPEPAMIGSLTTAGETAGGANLRALPNPTEGMTYVAFSVSAPQRAVLEVYDLSGRRIDGLFEGGAEAGRAYSFTYDGRGLPNGVYLFRLAGESEVLIEKVVIAR